MFRLNKFLFVSVFTLMSIGVFSQGKLYTHLDTMPSFPGGDTALGNFLTKNTVHPLLAIKNNVQGVVQMSFIIDTSGKVTEIKVIKGLGSGCDEEAVRVLSIMPNWNPGILNGQKVRVIYNVPFAFDIDQNIPRYAKNGIFIYQTPDLQAKWFHKLPFENYLNTQMRPYLKGIDSLYFDLQITVDTAGNVLDCFYTKSYPSDYSSISTYYEQLIAIIKETNGRWIAPMLDNAKVASTVFAKYAYKKK